MAQTFKFAYFVIILVSLFIVVVVGQKECDTEADCYKLYVCHAPGTMKCLHGVCVSPGAEYSAVVRAHSYTL
ncbi:unnamed protein product [Trifolium pratense]|uniref:Uncharacterized protein n=1 Tax=Trifolium pratense TaxID=57577 RepID=A0ACB0LM86_TRIPR|nr:unnamed protein product [Trifolium pratense]